MFSICMLDQDQYPSIYYWSTNFVALTLENMCLNCIQKESWSDSSVLGVSEKTYTKYESLEINFVS